MRLFRSSPGTAWHSVAAASVVLLIAATAISGCTKNEPAGAKTQEVAAQDDSTAAGEQPPAERLSANKPNPAADAALCRACEHGDLQAARDALKRGAGANARVASGPRTGIPALMLAGYDGHEQIARLLIDKGADVNALDPGGRTALFFAATGPFPETVQLLLANGAKVNIQDRIEHFTPLMHAAAEGQLEVVRVLLKHNADPKIKDVDGDTAADFAARNGHAAVARLLK